MSWEQIAGGARAIMFAWMRGVHLGRRWANAEHQRRKDGDA